MKFKFVILPAAAVLILLIFLFLSPIGYGVSGFFAKAFDKSMSPGERYDRNITIRKYYNLTIRFQKEGSTSYLSFDDVDSSIVLKAANGSVIKELIGINSGRYYALADNSEINSISTASALSISSYSDVIDQPVNISFIGTSAYLTIKVYYGQASISGYVIDDLTNELVSNVQVVAFADGSDPQVAEPIVQNSSMDGRYYLALNLSSSKSLEVYVKDYEVA
jgi:hypothetical protein